MNIGIQARLCVCSVSSVSDINECNTATHTCDVNADCSDTTGSYMCTCLNGYTGDGYMCQSKFVDQDQLVLFRVEYSET